MTEREKKIAIVDDLNDVIDKIDELLETTTSNGRRQMRTEVTCTWFDETLDELIDIASDTSKQSQIATYSDSLKNANVGSCSADEESNLETDKDLLEDIVEDYEGILNTATSSAITSSAITSSLVTTLASSVVTQTKGKNYTRSETMNVE